MSILNQRHDLELQTLINPELEDKSCYFESPFHHLHRQNADKTFDWFATDQVERFNSDSGYSQKDITYKFNRHGYRSDELQASPILFVGCSYTFGVGLRLEETWAKQVASHLKIPYVNIAYPGGSIQYMQRTLMKTFDLVKPSLVIALIPYNYRFEFVSSEGNNPIKVWSKSGILSPVFSGADKDRTYAYELFSTQKQDEFNLLNGIFSIKNYLEAKSCKLGWSLWRYKEEPSDYFKSLSQSSSFGTQWNTDIFDGHIRWNDLKLKARDSTHPGAQFHKTYADFILEKIKCLDIV